MGPRRWILILVVVAALGRPAAGARPQAAQSLPAAAGTRVTLETGPGQEHRFELSIPAGTFLHLVVHQRGVDVAVRLFGPRGGEPLAHANSPQGGYLPEVIAIIAADSGAHTLVLTQTWRQGRSGPVDVEVVAARLATPEDHRHVEAFTLIGRAEQERVKGTPAGFRAARELFAAAGPLFAAAGDRIGEADAVVGLARAADGLGEKKQALEIYARAREMHRAAGNPSGEAFTLNLAAVVHDFLGARDQAMAVLQQALPLAQRAKDPRVEALTVGNTGLIYFNTGDRAKALEYYERALVLHRNADNRRGEANTLLNIGSVKDVIGEKAAALQSMLEARDIRRDLGEPREEAIVLNNIGALYFSMDDTAKALEYYEQALPRWRAAGDLGGEAATIHNTGNVQEFLGEYQAALQRFSDALVLHRKSGFKVGEANTLTTYGRLSATLGDVDRAISAYNDALAIHRSAGNQPGVATILFSLGLAHESKGEFARAAEFFGQALPITQAVRNPLGEANVRIGIGRLALRRGELDAAADAFDRAGAIYREIEARRGEAMALGLRGEVEALRQRPDDGLKMVDEAIAVIRPFGDRTAEASLEHVAARIQAARGDLEDARRRNGAAIAIVESVRSRVAQEDFRTSYFATARRYYELEADVLMRLHERDGARGFDRLAFATSERARARALLDLLAEARANIREAVDPAVLTREQDVRHRLNVAAERQARLLAGRAAAPRLEAAARDVARLTDEYQRIEAEIRLASPRFSALTPRADVPAERVQHALLDQDTTLIEYMLGEERSFAWAISRQRVTSLVLPRRAVIEAAARRYAAAVAASAPTVAAEGSTLASMIFPGALQGIATKRIAIAADGALHLVPFGALPLRTGAGAAPLVSSHALIMVPSAAAVELIRSDAGRPAAPRTVMVLADPVFSASDARLASAVPPRVAPAAETVVRSGAGSDDTLALPRLINSRREANQILALLPEKSGQAAVDFDASRGRVAGDALKDFRIVHFATHVLIDDRHPELSGIALSSLDRTGKPVDGFLRLHDIYGLRLRADLVVLSACRTAAGKAVAGEGVVGLTRGFMYAGARRVVSTLWAVDDRATLELMTHFYKALLGPERLAPVAALRKAQLAMRASPRWQAPYYWAGFVIQGDWQ